MDDSKRGSIGSDVFFNRKNKKIAVDRGPHVSSGHVLVERNHKPAQIHVKSVQEVDLHPRLPVVHTSFKPSTISRTISACWTYKRHGIPIQGTVWKNADAEKREIAGGDEELRKRLRSSPHFEYFHIYSEGSKTYIVNPATHVSLSQVLSTHLIKLGKSYQSDWIVDIVGQVGHISPFSPSSKTNGSQLLSVLKHLHHCKIRHGSLKAKTIEFTSAGQMKIGKSSPPYAFRY
jgi:hypothetical protein